MKIYHLMKELEKIPAGMNIICAVNDKVVEGIEDGSALLTYISGDDSDDSVTFNFDLPDPPIKLAAAMRKQVEAINSFLETGQLREAQTICKEILNDHRK